MSNANKYNIVPTSDLDVDMVMYEGSDQFICTAARVSTLGSDAFKSGESEGLINFLMKNRHGTPFEHNIMTFRIQAPIFVWREFMRHRIGFSYNEESGRYRKLQPKFYVPPIGRPLVQEGKPGAYEFVLGTEAQDDVMVSSLIESYEKAWLSYQSMLDANVAKEVARMCLPLAIYSTAFVTCNARSLMSFLSLRTKDKQSTFPSYPQWEIEQVARRMEWAFSERFPITYHAFTQNGRVAP